MGVASAAIVIATLVVLFFWYRGVRQRVLESRVPGLGAHQFASANGLQSVNLVTEAPTDEIRHAVRGDYQQIRFLLENAAQYEEIGDSLACRFLQFDFRLLSSLDAVAGHAHQGVAQALAWQRVRIIRFLADMMGERLARGRA